MGFLILIFGFLLGFFSYIPVRRAFAAFSRTRAERTLQEWKGNPLPQGGISDKTGNIWIPAEENGKVRVLVFWSPTCRFCLDELGNLNVLQKKYGGRPDFILAGVLRQRDIELASWICEKRQVNWNQFFELDSKAPDSLSSQLGIRRIPSIWIVGQDNKINAAQVSVDEVSTILKGLLNY